MTAGRRRKSECGRHGGKKIELLMSAGERAPGVEPYNVPRHLTMH